MNSNPGTRSGTTVLALAGTFQPREVMQQQVPPVCLSAVPQPLHFTGTFVQTSHGYNRPQETRSLQTQTLGLRSQPLSNTRRPE